MLKHKLTAIFMVLSIGVTTATASPNVSPENMNDIFSDTGSNNQVSILSNQEMAKTEGEVAPLIYLVGSYAVRYGTKKVIKYYVKKQITKKQALNALKHGKSIYVKNNRTAKSLANTAYGKKNAVRHLTHKRSQVWKPHYQTSPNKYNSHVFYGR